MGHQCLQYILTPLASQHLFRSSALGKVAQEKRMFMTKFDSRYRKEQLPFMQMETFTIHLLPFVR
jgi:hypothetical protein